MEMFNKLVQEVAVCQLAVDEFEHVVGEDNAMALAIARTQLNTVKLALMRHVISESKTLMFEILEDQVDRVDKSASLPTSPSKAGVWKSQF